MIRIYVRSDFALAGMLLPPIAGRAIHAHDHGGTPGEHGRSWR